MVGGTEVGTGVDGGQAKLQHVRLHFRRNSDLSASTNAQQLSSVHNPRPEYNSSSGAQEGDVVGLSVGDTDGLVLGPDVGEAVGELVGLCVG